MREWGEAAGLLHDLGKFSAEFQAYLRQAGDSHESELRGKVDHTSAGAQWAVQNLSLLGHLIAYPIAGHHAGLLDAISEGACQQARLSKKIHALGPLPDALSLPRSLPPLPFLTRNPFSIAFFVRILFSCLVDADFLATEAFMNPESAATRPHVPTDALRRISDALDRHLDRLDRSTPVNRIRADVLGDCRRASIHEPGLFSLTVPTGGGKTFSSLSFALRHALAHGMDRILMVVPFTSIIEQTVDVLRSAMPELPAEWILEHHSVSDVDAETDESRLAAENWDAPIVVTTSVQFYESLFANRPSRCRKLHHIANSVILLDEAQTLPVTLLHPCLQALKELTRTYHASVVLCTATPPALLKSPDFPIGLEDVREIIPDPLPLFQALRRTEIIPRGRLTDLQLAEELLDKPQVLCIVNTRHHAAELYRRIAGAGDAFHLSALLCPAHRTQILVEVRQRLVEGRPVRLVSTQLIEAGVDVDFPVVYRSLAGIDSVAQSAGRCNRNGLQKEKGRVYLFESEHESREAFFRETAQITGELCAIGQDPQALDTVRRYFEIYYYRRQSDWDRHRIVKDLFKMEPDRVLPFLFQFASAADTFRLISTPQIPVFIPWEEGAELCRQLRSPGVPLNRSLLRKLRRYAVGVYPQTLNHNPHAVESAREGAFHLLISPDMHYHPQLGLTLSVPESSTSTLIC